MNTHFSNFRGLLVGLATTVLLMPAQAAELGLIPWKYGTLLLIWRVRAKPLITLR